MRRLFVLTLLYFIVIIEANPNEEQPKTVNLELETVLEFNQKDIKSDTKIIDDVQKFLTKIKTLLRKKAPNRRSFNDEDDFKFTNFLEVTAVLFKSYKDEDLQDVFSVVNDEMRRYHYRGCKFYELLENISIRKFLSRKLEYFKKSSAYDLRKELDKLLVFLRANKRKKDKNAFLEFINSLYIGHDSTQNLTNVLEQLKVFKKSSKRSKTDLIKIIREGIRAIIFDHYSNLNLNARTDVKKRLESYWNESDNTGNKVYLEKKPDLEKNKEKSSRHLIHNIEFGAHARNATGIVSKLAFLPIAKQETLNAEHVNDDKNDVYLKSIDNHQQINVHKLKHHKKTKETNINKKSALKMTTLLHESATSKKAILQDDDGVKNDKGKGIQMLLRSAHDTALRPKKHKKSQKTDTSKKSLKRSHKKRKRVSHSDDAQESVTKKSHQHKSIEIKTHSHKSHEKAHKKTPRWKSHIHTLRGVTKVAEYKHHQTLGYTASISKKKHNHFKHFGKEGNTRLRNKRKKHKISPQSKFIQVKHKKLDSSSANHDSMESPVSDTNLGSHGARSDKKIVKLPRKKDRTVSKSKKTENKGSKANKKWRIKTKNLKKTKFGMARPWKAPRPLRVKKTVTTATMRKAPTKKPIARRDFEDYDNLKNLKTIKRGFNNRAYSLESSKSDEMKKNKREKDVKKLKVLGESDDGLSIEANFHPNFRKNIEAETESNAVLQSRISDLKKEIRDMEEKLEHANVSVTHPVVKKVKRFKIVPGEPTTTAPTTATPQDVTKETLTSTLQTEQTTSRVTDGITATPTTEETMTTTTTEATTTEVATTAVRTTEVTATEETTSTTETQMTSEAKVDEFTMPVDVFKDATDDDIERNINITNYNYYEENNVIPKKESENPDIDSDAKDPINPTTEDPDNMFLRAKVNATNANQATTTNIDDKGKTTISEDQIQTSDTSKTTTTEDQTHTQPSNTKASEKTTEVGSFYIFDDDDDNTNFIDDTKPVTNIMKSIKNNIDDSHQPSNDNINQTKSIDTKNHTSSTTEPPDQHFRAEEAPTDTKDEEKSTTSDDKIRKFKTKSSYPQNKEESKLNNFVDQHKPATIIDQRKSTNSVNQAKVASIDKEAKLPHLNIQTTLTLKVKNNNVTQNKNNEKLSLQQNGYTENNTVAKVNIREQTVDHQKTTNANVQKDLNNKTGSTTKSDAKIKQKDTTTTVIPITDNIITDLGGKEGNTEESSLGPFSEVIEEKRKQNAHLIQDVTEKSKQT